MDILNSIFIITCVCICISAGIAYSKYIGNEK